MRKIILDTDFNHKLLSDAFVHIAPAPVNPVPESALTDPILLEVRDNPALQLKVKVMDIHRMPLCKLVNAYTLPSHGLYANDFIDWWLNKFPGTPPEAPMAVYFYKKIPAAAPIDLQQPPMV